MKNKSTRYKMAVGGPGPRRWDAVLNDPVLTGDVPFTATSATPPGAGEALSLSNTAPTWDLYTPSAAPASTRQRVNWNQLASYGSEIVPYATNIINAFRRPPKPARPTMDAPPVLRRVNYDNQRGEVNRAIAAANTGAERTLDGNTAARVRQFNLGTQLNSYSKIAEAENNVNVGIGNQQAMLNAQTAASNNAKEDEYNMALVERQVAQQREQSANVANAADKFVAIGNEKRKERTERQKVGTLMSLYSKSGVLRRWGQAQKARGEEDPMGQNWKWLNE